MANFLPRLIFKMAGWKIRGTPPPLKKFVIIGAPHTSNWDFVYGLCAWKLYGVNPRYLIKKELYVFPLNLLFKATGGLPGEKNKNSRLKKTILKKVDEKEKLVTINPPEGTPKLFKGWKTGFYYV